MKNYDAPRKSARPLLIILVVVGVSLIVFFAFTLPFLKNRGLATTGPDAPHSAISFQTTHSTPGSGLPDDSPLSARITTKEQTSSAAERLIRGLVEKISAENLEGAMEIIAGNNLDLDKVQRFRTLVTEGGYTVSPSAPYEEIGRLDTVTRYALNFHRPATSQLSGDEKRILVDLDRVKDSKAFHVINLHIPTFSVYSSVAKSATDAAAATVLKTEVSQPIVVEGDAAAPADPLMLAHQFVEAILKQDFAKAKSLVDSDSVTEEKLAGLFIVAEEQGFQRPKNTPLVATATRDDSAWVIAQLTSPKTKADFGLEIVKGDDASGHWKISALNLDKFLQASAKAAGAEDVTYIPVIKNPKGGDSLVLYFAYDEANLHPRAKRQIEIVAGILKADPEKTILINGHADAMGPDDYNQRLSGTRATKVKQGLIAAGVRPAQILTRSFGESEPLSPNIQPDGSDNPAGRKRNRRAEVYLNF